MTKTTMNYKGQGWYGLVDDQWIQFDSGQEAMSNSTHVVYLETLRHFEPDVETAIFTALPLSLVESEVLNQLLYFTELLDDDTKLNRYGNDIYRWIVSVEYLVESSRLSNDLKRRLNRSIELVKFDYNATVTDHPITMKGCKEFDLD